MFSSINQA